MLQYGFQSANIHISECAVIQSYLLTLCSQASVLAQSRSDSDRPRSLSLLSTAQLLCHLNPSPWGLSQELEPDWTAKVSFSRRCGVYTMAILIKISIPLSFFFKLYFY